MITQKLVSIPGFTAEAALIHSTTHSYYRATTSEIHSDQIIPQLSIKCIVKCAPAVVACGAICVASLGTACVECLATIGLAGCIDCFE